MWTKNTIDISIFHKNTSNSNIYSNSYIKEYLEKVVKIKMQVSAIGLPWLKNRTTEVMDEGTAKSYSDTQAKMEKLKWKKITDYTKDVQSSYKTLRNIKINIVEQESYSQYTWLSTHYSGSPIYTYIIHPSGILVWNFTFYADGLRPVITK